MFNRVPAEENQAESAHEVPKMTLTMAELADELHISLPLSLIHISEPTRH